MLRPAGWRLIRIVGLCRAVVFATSMLATASAAADGTAVLDWGSVNRASRPVSGLSGVETISAGGDVNLALLNDGTVMAWGVNEFGQLGDGTTDAPAVAQPPTPVSLSLPPGVTVTAISAGFRSSL